MNHQNQGMEKNYFIALGLSMLILFVSPFLMKPTPPANDQANSEVKKQIVQGVESSNITEKPTTAKSELTQKKEVKIEPVPLPTTIKIENTSYRAEFSTMGATLVDLFYKGEKGKEKLTETQFFKGSLEEPGIFNTNILGTSTNLTHAIYTVVEGQKNPTFVYKNAEEFEVRKEFIFDSYLPAADLFITVKNLSKNTKSYPLELLYGMNFDEESASRYDRTEALIFTDKIEARDTNKIKKKGFPVSDTAAWSGFVKKYFALLIKPEDKIIESKSSAQKGFAESVVTLEPISVAPGASQTIKLKIYMGPQRYETLKAAQPGFEDVISRGFFGLFKLWLLNALKFFYKFTGNFGWSIILLTILIKLLFFPLTQISSKSMKKMQALAPKQKEIQAKYKEDPQRAQKEVMALYKRNEVNPMMGCLPMLIQFPVLIAMFQLLPEAIELHGEPFLFWITDLSEQDRFMTLPFSIPFMGDALNILPMFMIFSQVAYQKMIPQTSASPEQAKIMAIMPWFFGVICYKFSSGLVLYWIFQNLFSVAQQSLINRTEIILHKDDK